ncbi:hypothetical protein L9F63_010497, partial [Diploptera punctata]
SRYSSRFSSGVGEIDVFPSGVGEMFFPRESGKMLWDVFSSSPTGGSRYSLVFSLGNFSLGSRGNVVVPSGVVPMGVGKISRYSPDFSLGTRGKCFGEIDVGRFLLFSHWGIPIFFRFFHRESGKCSGSFSPLHPLEGPDILQVFPSGKMLWDVFSSSPTGGSRYSSVFFPRQFFPRESGKCCCSLGSRENVVFLLGSCGTFSPLLPLEDPDILQVFRRESGKCCGTFSPLLPLEGPDIL